MPWASGTRSHESRQWEVLVIKTFFFSENISFCCFKGQPESQEGPRRQGNKGKKMVANSVDEEVPTVRSGQGSTCREGGYLWPEVQVKVRKASLSQPQAAQWNLVGVMQTQYDRQ